MPIEVPKMGEQTPYGPVPISQTEEIGTYLSALAIGSAGVGKISNAAKIPSVISDAITGMVFQDPTKGEKTISPWLLDKLHINNGDVQKALDSGNYDELTGRIVNGGEWSALGLVIPKTARLAWLTAKGVTDGLIRLAKGELKGMTPGMGAAEAGHIGPFRNQREFGDYLMTQQKPIAETPENIPVIAQTMQRETLAAMAKDGNAATWYRDRVTGAKQIAALVHPEILEDPYSATAWEAAVAFMSNGTAVADNARFADRAYTEFKAAGGIFPETITYAGKSSPSISNAFIGFNRLVKDLGEDDAVKFLETQFTVKELNGLIAKYGGKISGELMSTQVYGSAMFGPKIGNGFFQNLHGNFDQLTMDRWWMRMWGRITGTLTPKISPETEAMRLDKFRGLLTPELAKTAGVRIKDVGAAKPESLRRAARVIFGNYRKGGFVDRSELNRVAKGLVEHETMLQDAPLNGAQRAYMRQTATHALTGVNEAQSVQIALADLQALLWYPEKDLYAAHGVADAKAAPTDYQTEFAKLALMRGIDADAIARATGTVSP
jgi:hypothetical protein